MATAHISFGGNLGDVAATFDRAVDLLAENGVEVLQISSLFSTVPVGASAGDVFLNAAAEVFVGSGPLLLLEVLRGIEDTLGRVRTERWGPRTIDLDIVFFENACISLPQLTIPHPHCWYRRFVLDPLDEIAGDYVHPQKHLTVTQLRKRLLSRPLEVAIVPGDDLDVSGLCSDVHRRFPDVDACRYEGAGEEPPAFVAFLQGSDAQFETLPEVPRIDLRGRDPQHALVETLTSAGCEIVDE